MIAGSPKRGGGKGEAMEVAARRRGTLKRKREERALLVVKGKRKSLASTGEMILGLSHFFRSRDGPKKARPAGERGIGQKKARFSRSLGEQAIF